MPTRLLVSCFRVWTDVYCVSQCKKPPSIVMSPRNVRPLSESAPQMEPRGSCNYRQRYLKQASSPRTVVEDPSLIRRKCSPFVLRQPRKWLVGLQTLSLPGCNPGTGSPALWLTGVDRVCCGCCVNPKSLGSRRTPLTNLVQNRVGVKRVALGRASVCKYCTCLFRRKQGDLEQAVVCVAVFFPGRR